MQKLKYYEHMKTDFMDSLGMVDNFTMEYALQCMSGYSEQMVRDFVRKLNKIGMLERIGRGEYGWVRGYEPK